MGGNVMKVLAGIVLFNPEMERLNENIQSIAEQVEEVLLIDNHSKNREEIAQLSKNYKKCKVIYNVENLGVACALNQILQYASEEGYEWFLTLDQDSVCYPGLIQRYKTHTNIENLGMMTSWIVERNTDEEGKYPEDSEVSYITECITSAGFVNTKACIDCGGWDEVLYIDSVDYELCYRMKAKDYQMIRVHQKGVLHEIGQSRIEKVLWWTDLVTNHSAFRHYYMARNKVYLSKKYPEIYGLKRELLRELHKYRIILMYEDDKLNKLKARFRGIRDGFKIGHHSVD